MRETAMQFPEDIRDDIIIDIQDVETEINKPKDQWDRPRLKKCLKGIAAGVAAGRTHLNFMLTEYGILEQNY